MQSLARPGGNVTGLQTQGVSIFKLYQLLQEASPKVSRLVFLWDPASAAPTDAERPTSIARAENVDLQIVDLYHPNDVARAFAEFRRGGNGLVLDRPTNRTAEGG